MGTNPGGEGCNGMRVADNRRSNACASCLLLFRAHAVIPVSRYEAVFVGSSMEARGPAGGWALRREKKESIGGGDGWGRGEAFLSFPFLVPVCGCVCRGRICILSLLLPPGASARLGRPLTSFASTQVRYSTQVQHSLHYKQKEVNSAVSGAPGSRE